MEKGKIRITPKLIALLVAGGIALTPVEGSCITNNSHDPGTFVKKVEEIENAKYGIYIVKEGDNASRISEKICSHLRTQITTKYWIVVKFLNPKPLHPNDEIIFPLDVLELDELYNMLGKTGWKAKYIQTHNVYDKKEKKDLSINAVGLILSDIFKDDGVCVDPDFIKLYLEVTGLDDKYNLVDNDTISNNDYFALTDWIPTLDEINEYQENNKTKVKKKNK